MTISIYKSISDTKGKQTIVIDQFLSYIKEGRWKDKVMAIRETQDPELKKQMPIATVSGRFAERNKANLLEHSGFICIDIDNIEPEQMVDVANKIWGDIYTYASFKSIRGNGLAVLVKIDPAKHEDAFEGLERYYAQTYQISIDRSCKDVSRARFVSYDPHLYENKRSHIFKKYIPKKDAPKNVPSAVLPNADLNSILSQIAQNKIDITNGDYHTWLRIGFAIADYFDEAGRAYFHAISENSDKYNQKVCDRQYTACLKGKGSGVHIGTFLYHCKEAGIQTISRQTNRVIKAVEQGKKTGQKKENIIRTMSMLEGMDEADVKEIVDKAYDATDLKPAGTTSIDTIELYVNTNYKLQFNTITKRLENNSEPLDDRGENSMFINLKSIEPKISQDLLRTYLRSDRITAYNPLLTFLESNSHRTPSGIIKSIADCIEGRNGELDNGDVVDDYVELFLTKFYLGLIAGAIGDEVPPIVPVLYGNKIGTGKTELWRKLLPKELRSYYQESSLSKGQDDEILMSMKWIICDDEWRGKMSQDARYMKSVSGTSSSTLRRAYARDYEDVKRLAMLCGTSNDTDIIQEGSNRRIVPIHCTHIDLEAYYKIDKTDALIEAYHLYTSAGESAFLNAYENDMLQKVSMKNTAPDANEELLLTYYEMGEPQDANCIALTATEIASQIQSRTQIRVSAVGIGRCLNRLSFNKGTEKKPGCSSRQIYFVVPIRQQSQ
jgi:hypothetical protein